MSSINSEMTTMATLANSRTPRKLAAGDFVYRDGEQGNTLFGVVSGEIELSSEGTATEVIDAGSSFGAAALLDADHRRFGSAKALTDAEILEMNREEFLFAMQELPMFGLEILHDLEIRLQKLKAGPIQR